MKNEQQQQELIDLIYEHQGILHRICSIYCGSREDREDCYQDMILQLWRSFPSFRGGSQFSTWMYRVALNTALLHRRRASRRRDAATSWRQIPDSASSPAAGDDEDVTLLYDCIRKLPELDRAIVMLYLEQQTYEEIASILGLSRSNVSVRIVRIKKKLHELLVSKGYKED